MAVVLVELSVAEVDICLVLDQPQAILFHFSCTPSGGSGLMCAAEDSAQYSLCGGGAAAAIAAGFEIEKT